MPDIHMTHIFENVAYLAKKYVCVLYIIYIYISMCTWKRTNAAYASTNK